MIEGKRHHFSCGGLYNGLSLLIDDETRTWWDHITGVGLHGPLAGVELETWPLVVTTVAEALTATPDLEASISRPGLFGRFMAWTSGPAYVRGRGFLPPGFRSTMGPADARLPDMTHGLAVVVGKRARFYPLSALGSPVTETWEGVSLTVQVGADGMPGAALADGTLPMQIFLRWYGFAYSWPGGAIYGMDSV